MRKTYLAAVAVFGLLLALAFTGTASAHAVVPRGVVPHGASQSVLPHGAAPLEKAPSNSDAYVQRDLGTFATAAEAERAVLAASKHPVLKSTYTMAFTPDNCLTGEAAHICADWAVLTGGGSWNVQDVHSWNPGPYGTVGFKLKSHSGFVHPEQLANLGVTRCWLDNTTTDTCSHDISSNMYGYWSNTLQICERHSVSVKATYTLTPFAKALSPGCSF